MYTHNNYHGATQPRGISEPGWQFTGEHGPQEVEKLKMLVINDLRLLSLDRFLTEPLENLTPDRKLYDIALLADQRKFKNDCEEVLKQATQAWTIIRQRFKAGSAAESLIKPCDEEGAADRLWQTFTSHYCNRTTRSGIMQIIERFFDDKIAVNSDILSYFTLYTEVFREIMSVPQLQSTVTSLTGLSSPLRLRLPLTATPQQLAGKFADTLSSEASTPASTPAIEPKVLAVSTFPQWAQVLFILFRIAQFPNHKKFIKDFLFEYVTKAIEKNIETMTTSECFSLLKAYTKIWPAKNSEVSPDVLLHYTEKAKLYCDFHGENVSHTTKDCNDIHKLREEKGTQPTNNQRSRNFTSYNNQSRGRDSRQSFQERRERGPYRSRNSYSRGRDRSRSRDRSSGRYDRSPSPYQPPAGRYDRSPSTYSQIDIAQHNTEINQRTAAKDPDWHSGIHGYGSSELPPGYRGTPPQSDYDSHTDIGENDTELGPPTQFHTINIYCNIVELASTVLVQIRVVLGDSACNGFLLNKLNEHLAYNKEECVGTVWGANGPMPGAITHKGFVNFMGVTIRCYIGNFSKGAGGQNWMAVHYGFEWRIKGHYCDIYSSRSGQSATVKHNPENCLTELPETLFGPPIGSVNVEMHQSTMDPTHPETLWHFRLGHINDKKFKFMKNQTLYTDRGIPLTSGDQQTNTPAANSKPFYCDICDAAKGHRVVSHKAVDKDKSPAGTTWHVDCPAQSDTPALITGNRSRILFAERQVRLTALIPMRDNTEPEVLKAAEHFHDHYLAPVKEWYRDTRQRLTIYIHADNGEMAYPKVIEYFRSKAVFIFFTAPDHSSSNGLAEVRIKLVRQMSRALMLTHGLPEEFFEKAEAHAVYLLNRTPFMYKGKFQVDPYTLFTGKTADYSILRVFGSKVWVFTRTVKDSRARSTQGIFVGFAPNSNTPVVYLPTEGKFVNSGHVSFRELAEDALQVQVVPDEQQWSVITSADSVDRLAFLLSNMTLNC